MFSSIVSYKDRGKYGTPGYIGNCTGRLIKDMILHYRPQTFVDCMVGGGTSFDVIDELRREGSEIEFFGLDLHSGFNILKDSLTKRIGGARADYVWMHPPYFKMLRYSNNQWGNKVHPDDLSQCEDYGDFLSKMVSAMHNIDDATAANGKYSILIGDYRKNDEYISIQSDLIKLAPGKLEGIVIKAQHNCTSDRKTYAKPLIRIEHEYLLNFRKDRVVFGLLDTTLNVSRRLELLSRANWSGVIRAALAKLGGKGQMQDIYQTIERDAPTVVKPRKNWQARVRAELQIQPAFINQERGVWALAA